MNNQTGEQATLVRRTRTIKEAAEEIGVSYHTVQRLIYAGMIKTVPGLRTRLIPITEIERYLEVR